MVEPPLKLLSNQLMTHQIATHIRKEMTTTGVSNAIFNGLAAMALANEAEPLPLWGLPASIAVDIAATSMILLFIVALIVIPLNRSKVGKGKVAAFHWDNDKALHRFWQRLPSGLVARAFCFAAIGLVIVAPVSISYYLILGVESMASQDYAVAKGLWAGIMAAIMCVPMIQLGLSDPAAPLTTPGRPAANG